MRLLISVFVFYVLSVIPLQAQQVTNITLQPIKADYVPNEFFISKVIDGRGKKGTFGTIDKGGEGKSVINTKAGIGPTISDFVNNHVTQNRSKAPVNLSIRQLNITVKNKGGKWVTEAAVVYGYYNGDVKLLEFSNSGQQESTVYSIDFIEAFIRRSLASGMKRFDAWAADNKARLAAPGSIPAKSAGGLKNAPSVKVVPKSNKPYQDKAEALEAFDLLNKIRVSPKSYLPFMGIKDYSKVTTTKLVWNATLAKAAEVKAMDMAKREYFAHVDPEGYGMNYHINKAGYQLDAIMLNKKDNNFFESIQAGAIDGDAVIKELIIDEGVSSFGHRKHLLGLDKWNSSLVDIGIGFVRVDSGSKYRTYTSIIIAKHK